MARCAGRPDAALYEAIKGCTVTENAGIRLVSGRHVAGLADGKAAPGHWVCSPCTVAILATIDKAAFGDVKSRIAPRAAVRRSGMAPLAESKV